MTAANSTGRSPRERGTGWVIVQFTLMLAGFAAGPTWRAQWSGWWTWVTGGMLMMLAAWAGLRGGRDLGTQRTPFPKPRDESRLVTSGMYANVRHPLYVGVIALGFAWALLWQSGPALAVAVLQAPFFDLKARREERWLRERFPDYQVYARRVKRFIPGLY